MIRKNLQLLQLTETLENRTGVITLRELDARQRFIHQDEQMHMVYIIKSGVAKCFRTEENDKDYIFEFLGEGEVLGEIEAIRSTPALSSVEAITPLVVYVMGREDFRHFLRTVPDFNALILDMLATRVFNSSVKMSRQQLYALGAILPQLLSALDAQQITFTKQDLSEYLGISVRSLNRLLQQAGKEELL